MVNQDQLNFLYGVADRVFRADGDIRSRLKVAAKMESDWLSEDFKSALNQMLILIDAKQDSAALVQTVRDAPRDNPGPEALAAAAYLRASSLSLR